MAKATRTTTGRDTASSRFVARGTKVGKFVAAGSTPEGIVIVEPRQGPKNFTKAQIRRAVRDVKERQRRGELEAAG